MIVGDLIKKLSEFDDSLEVFYWDTEFDVPVSMQFILIDKIADLCTNEERDWWQPDFVRKGCWMDEEEDRKLKNYRTAVILSMFHKRDDWIQRSMNAVNL